PFFAGCTSMRARRWPRWARSWASAREPSITGWCASISRHARRATPLLANQNGGDRVVRMERTRRFAPEVLQAVAEGREEPPPRCKRQRRELYRETWGGDALHVSRADNAARKRGRRFEWYRDDAWRRRILGA